MQCNRLLYLFPPVLCILCKAVTVAEKDPSCFIQFWECTMAECAVLGYLAGEKRHGLYSFRGCNAAKNKHCNNKNKKQQSVHFTPLFFYLTFSAFISPSVPNPMLMGKETKCFL